MIVIPIIGESGSGKTASARNLIPDNTLWISVLGKRPPFKNAKEYIRKEGETKNKDANFFISKDPKQIVDLVKLKLGQEGKNFDVVFIDDTNYLAALSFLSKATEIGFTKFSILAQQIYSFVSELQAIKSDAVCFLTWHIDVSDTIDPMADSTSKIAMKVPSKFIKEHINLDGLFEIILYSYKTQDVGTKKILGKFKTIDTVTTAKTPMGLFDDEVIDNDLEPIRLKLVDYYGL